MKTLLLFLSLVSVALGSTAVVYPGAKNVTFGATAQGTQPFTYQWYGNGWPIVGQTGPFYIIPVTLHEDQAEYRCVVTNTAGFTTSDIAYLFVVDPPDLSLPEDTRAQNAALEVGMTYTPGWKTFGPYMTADQVHKMHFSLVKWGL